MATLFETYQQTVAPALQKELGLASTYAIPRLQKIVINTSVSQPQDPRARRQVLDNLAEQMAMISGQKAMITTASKSIAGFKLRQGDPLGVKVTLRGKRMWEFLDKLISIALPRVKDFRGVSRTAFDGQGNYALGLEEQIIFPEIKYDQIESIRGLQIIFVTSTEEDQQALRLLELLGVPFEKVETAQ